MANPYVKQYLMTAGPTPLPPAVSQVMAEPMVYHRAPAFIEVYARVLSRLKDVFHISAYCRELEGKCGNTIEIAGCGYGATQ